MAALHTSFATDGAGVGDIPVVCQMQCRACEASPDRDFVLVVNVVIGTEEIMSDDLIARSPSPKPRTSASTLPKEGEGKCVDTNAQRESEVFDLSHGFPCS